MKHSPLLAQISINLLSERSFGEMLAKQTILADRFQMFKLGWYIYISLLNLVNFSENGARVSF